MKNQTLTAISTLTKSFLVTACLAVPAAAQFSAYHNLTGGQHQTKVNNLVSAGYRMVSLSVHGTTGAPRYTAVWRKTGGPAWKAFHGMPIANYQNYYNAQRNLGYSPRMVSATGSSVSAVMAGVFVKDTADVKSWHGLTASGFGDKCQWAQDNGYILEWAAAYGTALNRRFLGIFRENVDGTHWSHGVDDTKTSYTDRKKAHADAWVRPSFLTASSAGRITSIWRDDKIGSYLPFVDLTAASYQNLTNLMVASGYFPMQVQGAGNGAATRYCGIFAKSTAVQPRVFSTRGVAFPAMQGFDDFMQQQMQDKGVRAGALAIAKDGRLVYARGFTLAEAGYPITAPASLFRMASCSKPLTSIAIHHAIQKGQIKLSDKLVPLLRIASGTINDQWMYSVTVDHLLNHTGGWDSKQSIDPLFADATISSWGRFGFPVSKSNIAAYMTQTQFLQNSPGTKYAYSNYGYMLLGMILDQKNPGTYEDFVRKNVFSPLGLIRPRIGGSTHAGHTPTEVRYHNGQLVLRRSVMSNARPTVHIQYGGYNLNNHDANGGWIMSAPDYAKVLAAFDMGPQNPILNPAQTTAMFKKNPVTGLASGWGRSTLKDAFGKNVLVYTHSGGFGGTRTYIMRRADGLSFAMFFNGPTAKTTNGKGRGTNLNEIANNVAAWPNVDLFPSFGIPAFKSRVVGQTQSFGRGCAGSNGAVMQSATGLPEIGYFASYLVQGARNHGMAMFHLGLSKTTWNAMSLPLPLDSFGAAGCSLYVAPGITAPALANASGVASVGFPIPNDPVLIGKRFFTQFSCVDPLANKLGLSFSNAIQTIVGGFK